MAQEYVSERAWRARCIVSAIGGVAGPCAALCVALNLAGTACGPDGCQKVALDPTTQNNIRGEQTDFNNDLQGLQIYPIVSIGFSYKFGK